MINEILTQYIKNKTVAKEIGDKIQSSKSESAVLFIDLCGSTQIKNEIRDEDWLSYIYVFIQFIEELCIANNGIVVKQIGDELLLTFNRIEDSEEYLRQLLISEEFNSTYSYKIAADYGFVYKLDFINIKSDPYGLVVDRCSRISKLCDKNTILCSNEYFQKTKGEYYLKTIAVELKGIKEPVEIYYRPISNVDNTKNYYEVILTTLNNSNFVSAGYKYIPRKFSEQDLYKIKSTRGMPYLVRYLLNVPDCPYNPIDLMKNYNIDDSKDTFSYIGYSIKITSNFNKYKIEKSNHDGEHILVVSTTNINNSHYIYLYYINIFYHDVVRSINDNVEIIVKGIITDISKNSICLDYCEFIEIKNA